MDQVTVYSAAHQLQKSDATFVLDNYFRLVKWDPDERCTILDVGCGDGDVTLELLVPRLPKNFKNLIATDVLGEMINFAKLKCRNSKVSFDRFDISADNVPVDYEKRFDHIFSFYCLHWIQNQRYSLND